MDLSMNTLVRRRNYTYGHWLPDGVAAKSKAFLEKSRKLLCPPPPDAYDFIKAFVAGMIWHDPQTGET
jgi:hypothetical protein